MLFLSAFYRGLLLYFILIIVWPYIFGANSATSLVKIANSSQAAPFFANIKIVSLSFLFFIPLALFTKNLNQHLVRKNKRVYENIWVVCSIVVYVTILNVIISLFLPVYASKELFGHFYLLSTFTELFFIHFINQKLNTEQALENIS